jgi:hypothetical protein
MEQQLTLARVLMLQYQYMLLCVELTGVFTAVRHQCS